MIKEEEIKKEFEKLKKDLGFKTELDELDEIFYIRNLIREHGIISTSFSRQICRRISDYLASWNEFLHRILMPNQGSIVSIQESRIFSEEEKEEIQEVFAKVMELISRNSLLSTINDKDKESAWIDETYKYVKEFLIPKLATYFEKINKMWAEDIKIKKEKVSYSS